MIEKEIGNWVAGFVIVRVFTFCGVRFLFWSFIRIFFGVFLSILSLGWNLVVKYLRLQVFLNFLPSTDASFTIIFFFLLIIWLSVECY